MRLFNFSVFLISIFIVSCKNHECETNKASHQHPDYHRFKLLNGQVDSIGVSKLGDEFKTIKINDQTWDVFANFDSIPLNRTLSFYQSTFVNSFSNQDTIPILIYLPKNTIQYLDKDNEFYIYFIAGKYGCYNSNVLKFVADTFQTKDNNKVGMYPMFVTVHGENGKTFNQWQFYKLKTTDLVDMEKIWKIRKFAIGLETKPDTLKYFFMDGKDIRDTTLLVHDSITIKIVMK